MQLYLILRPAFMNCVQLPAILVLCEAEPIALARNEPRPGIINGFAIDLQPAANVVEPGANIVRHGAFAIEIDDQQEVSIFTYDSDQHVDEIFGTDYILFRVLPVIRRTG